MQGNIVPSPSFLVLETELVFKLNPICSDKSSLHAVRLVGGRNVLSQGRVELFYNGTWGTVCGSNWKLRDANVVCHQLGFEGAQSALIRTQTVFGRGKGNIWYFQLRCIGNENSLTDCGQGVWYYSSYCSSHFNDAGVAGVVCRTGTKSYKTVNLFILFCQKFYHVQKVPIARQASKQK